MDCSGIGHRAKCALLAAIVVLSAAGLSVGAGTVPPEGEPNDARDTATEIESGETISGAIPTEDDVDWFTFEAQRGETVNGTATLEGGFGIRFRFFGPDGNSVTGISGRNETVTGGFTVRTSGTYYVRARKFTTGEPPTNYTFTLRTYATTDREPNERRANATRLSLNASVEDTLSQGDVDWYAFEVQEGGSIEISGTVSEGSGAIDFKLVNRTGDSVANRGNVDGGEYAFNATARYTGVYYVSVRQSSAPNPDYTLEVRTNATDDAGSDSTEQGGGGLPVVPIAVAAGLAVVLVGVVLWRRSDDEGRG